MYSERIINHIIGSSAKYLSNAILPQDFLLFMTLLLNKKKNIQNVKFSAKNKDKMWKKISEI